MCIRDRNKVTRYELTPDKVDCVVFCSKNYAPILPHISKITGRFHTCLLYTSFVEDMYLKDYYANITMMADTNLVEELTLALPLPVNVPLYSVLSKTINHLSAEELVYILAQDLLTIQKRSVTFKTLLYTNPLTMLVVCVGFILLLSVIIL